MALKDTITEQMKTAMKARDAARLSAIRLILAGIQEKTNAMTGEAAAKGMSDDEILSLMAKMIKQREESAATYAGAGRTDLESVERAEMAVIREFMPRQLSEAETRAEVTKLVGELGAGSMKDMGRVMGALKERHSGSMDFARAGAIVKELLTPK